MTNPATQPQVESDARFHEMFPILTEVQIGKISKHGHKRQIQKGEVLLKPGDVYRSFFVVLSAQIQAISLRQGKEEIIATCKPGMFTGEVSLLSGQRGVALLRANEEGETIEIDR